jgi:hypothetical protein
MTPSELELIYEEIEICYVLSEDENPYVAHLLNVFENEEYFLLIMELV